MKSLTEGRHEQALLEIVGKEKLEQFHKTGDLDTSIGLEGLSRIRINAYVANERRCLTLRILPDNLPRWQDLGLPQPFIDLTQKHRGLVLCTGPTGSGKSTTLAAFINCISKHRNVTSLPLKIRLNSNSNANTSIIHQREVKRDTQSFASALKAALREDPDVIYIGEMRDLETIQLAITAAETGHLVLGTLHTSSAAKTVERIVDVFPGDQEQARLQVSTSLLGTCLKHYAKTPVERSLAYELLVNTPAIANLIRERKVSQIYSQLQTGSKEGMNTSNNACSAWSTAVLSVAKKRWARLPIQKHFCRRQFEDGDVWSSAAIFNARDSVRQQDVRQQTR